MPEPRFSGFFHAPIELFSATRRSPGGLLLRVSSHGRRETLQLDQAAHVVGEVLQPDPRLRPHQPDTTYQRPAHVVALGPEDMLDADPNRRTGLVALLLAAQLSGLLRRPLRWIRLRNPFSFSAASISAER